MVKTLRISDDNLHKELLKIQGEIQAKSGEFTSMDDVIAELVKNYRKKSR
jgi:predicted CopG family antitoxin